MGGSRGFGEALWQKLHEVETNQIMVYSRSGLSNIPTSGRVEHCPMDIGNVDTLPDIFSKSLEKLKSQQWDNVTLVNNAAVLGPLLPVREIKDYKEVQQAININYTSRFILTGIFLREFSEQT